uniref:CXXC-type domain-containing protein n=1 Tax=Timema douglasi TaxID=61478 RepID=A0A7R8VI67_TIMDO|nr:unnamed protein product [Timema douglasi]
MEIDTPILESLKTDSQMSHEINIKSESIDNICVKSDIINEVDSQQNQAHNIGFPIHGTNVIYPYHIQDRIKTDCFSQNLVTELKGSDFNLAYIQKHGFDVPVLFRDKEGLGLKVPGPKFSVRHVRMYIGSKYDLEVFDVGSGRTGLMLMKDFYKYYRDPNKDRLLDVLSLEFSHTKMNNLMLAPSVVRELDWAECTWPKNMKQAHSSHKALKYPKVQKYCLLSVKGCYTDFHTEIGGSSSWYHVVRGKKELHGLKSIVLFLHILPANEKNVPQSIKDPIGLIKDVRTLVEQHRHDDHTLAITGKAVLGNILNTIDGSPSTPEEPSVQPGGASTARRRRTHCRKCSSCLSKECGSCYHCRNMVKLGGTRQAKQSCARRLCLQPVLPVTTVCSVCGLDGGWRRHVTHPATAGGSSPSLLMECILCMDIVHRNCAAIQCRDHHGIVYNEMPSFWKCPKCCKEGGTIDHKLQRLQMRHTSEPSMDCPDVNSKAIDCKDIFKTEIMEEDVTIKLETSNVISMNTSHPLQLHNSSDIPMKKAKLEHSLFLGKPFSLTETSTKHEVKGLENLSSDIVSNKTVVGSTRHQKIPLRIQLTQQMLRNSIRILKKPYFTVRPSSAISKICLHNWMSPAGNNVKVPQLDLKCLLPIFKFLSRVDLYQCSQVCKTWSQCTIHPSLWQTMDVSHKQLTVSSLIGIVRRQPKFLVLDWAQVSKRQLEWLLGRLPQLKKLSLHGCPWGNVSALKTCLCPPLTSLDLSFVSGLQDALLRELLSAPMDTRPGLTEFKCRLKGLQMLKLAGCDISDLSLRYIVQCLPTLKVLDVSLCSRITDAGVAQLGIHPASTIVTLEKLDLSSCRLLTDSCLEHLTQCKALVRLDLRFTSVTSGAIEKFILDSVRGLKVMNEKLLIEM